jgi:hypothetical protein
MFCYSVPLYFSLTLLAPTKVLKLEPSTVANLQRLNASIEQMAQAMDEFESMAKSISSITDSVAAIVDKLAM